MALHGAIDTHLLMTGSADDVKTETQRVVETLKPGGGYVCAPDQYFPNFPVENIKALYDTAEAYGRY